MPGRATEKENVTMDRRGATMIEYALFAALVAVAAIGALIVLSALNG